MSEYIPPRPDLPPPGGWLPPPSVGHFPQAIDAPVATWRWWEAVFVFLGASVLGAAAGLGILSVLKNSIGFYLTAIAADVILFGVLVLWLQTYHKTWKQVIGLPERPLREIGAGIVGGLAVYGLAAFGVGTILTIIFDAFASGPVETPTQLPGRMSGATILLAAILAIGVAPIAEEFFFRGCLFRAFRARRAYWLAALWSSLLFGLAHYQPDKRSGIAGAFLLVTMMFSVGFGLSYVYEKRRNIVASMAAHATFNVIGFLFIVFVR